MARWTWNQDHWDKIERRQDEDGHWHDAVVECELQTKGKIMTTETITIAQYLQMYGSTNSILWNLEHINRYKNTDAAMQWLTAKANESHCWQKSIEMTDRWEETGDRQYSVKADEFYRLAQNWQKAAQAFAELRDKSPELYNSAMFSDVWSGDDSQVDTGLTDDRPYKPATMGGDDDIPF